MSSNVVNQVAYLRTTRSFPLEIENLSVEINKAYVDIANTVNNRTISLFPTSLPAQNGESWFVYKNQKQQGFRQVYTFSSTADIEIGFKFSTIDRFVRFFGTYTDGTNWYGLIPATSVAIAGQIGFFILLDGTSTTTDLIRLTVGAGAPALTSGNIVIEWIAKV